jgi:hypothetical protein
VKERSRHQSLAPGGKHSGVAHARGKHRGKTELSALRSRKPMIVVLAGLVIIAAAAVPIIRTGKPDKVLRWAVARPPPMPKGRQAFQGPVAMTIQNNKADSITGLPLRGYGIAGGVAGGLPRLAFPISL